jgi:hypothetical protein
MMAATPHARTRIGIPNLYRFIFFIPPTWPLSISGVLQASDARQSPDTPDAKAAPSVGDPAHATA